MLRSLTAVLVLLPTAALAAETGGAPVKTHHEFSFRGRAMSVPSSILDIWYFGADDAGWALPGEDRPAITGNSLGIEYTLIRDKNRFTFFVDNVNSTMKAGYWDDREDPADHFDGSYLVPTSNFGFVTTGVDFGYDLELVRTDQTNGVFGLSFVPSGGIGVLVKKGDINEWRPNGGVPAYVSYAAGLDPDRQVKAPPVLPMIDVNLGLKFNFGDRVVARVEGGLHNTLFYGGSVGVMF